MNTNWETFLTAYNQASPDVKAIIDSDHIVVFVDVLCQKYDFDQSKKRDLVIGLSDVILSTRLDDDFINDAVVTTGIPSLHASEFSSDIKNFLGAPNRTPKLTTLVAEQSVPTKEAATVLSTSILSENLPTSSTHTTVKPMRTFPDDINAGRAHSYGAFRPDNEDSDPDEPTHSTSQDDILRK